MPASPLSPCSNRLVTLSAPPKKMGSHGAQATAVVGDDPPPLVGTRLDPDQKDRVAGVVHGDRVVAGLVDPRGAGDDTVAAVGLYRQAEHLAGVGGGGQGPGLGGGGDDRAVAALGHA